ncbi:MAG: hypothetical protein ABSG19_12435 [Candidatus Aminicenantales bacterium]
MSADSARAKKRRNTRARGNDFQDRCAGYLTGDGYGVHNEKTVAKALLIKGRTIWTSQRNDVFGAFDLVAAKAGEKPRFIQVTLDSSVSKRVKEVNGIAWPLEHMTIELWQGRDRGEVTVSVFDGTEFREAGRYLRGVFYRKELDLAMKTMGGQP